MLKVVKLNILFILFCFLGVIGVKANSIEKIDMDVFLDEFGNALVTEIWDANLTSGTEGYRSFSRLEDKAITNFSVSDEKGNIYTILPSWNTSASFNEKSLKGGIHYIQDGLELCWGISEYGHRKYTLKYEISHLVTQYTDTQGIYFNFLNLDQAVGDVKITIRSNVPFSLSNSRIWAFGNKGSINFSEGNIVLTSNGKLKKTQYMVGLVRFESNLFNINSTSSKSFDDVYNSAFSDVKENSSSWKEFLLIFIYCLVLLVPFIIKIILDSLRVNKIRNSANINLEDCEVKIKIKSDQEIPYYRDIPCQKNIIRAYQVCRIFDIKKENVLKKGLIGAILLKWLKDNLISIQVIDDLDFNEKNNDYIIDLTKINNLEDPLESELLELLKIAAGENALLEAKEFPNWCRNNSKRLNRWFIHVKEKMMAEFDSEGIKPLNSPLLIKEAIEIQGLEKFLLDFGRMGEKSAYEVSLWEEYLMFAELLGIAAHVAEQFKKVCPEFIKETNIDFHVQSLFDYLLDDCISNMDAGLEIGRMIKEQEAIAKARRYSGKDKDSGGGGSSYSSGGSSAGGSSGGGFR